MGSQEQTAPPVPPSGRQLELRAGEYRATVVQGGGGLRALEHRGGQLLDGYRAEEPCGGGRGQLLVPWPNRVQGGRYEFAGETRQLAITEPERNCAIHGLARWSQWEIIEQTPERLSLHQRLYAQPGYPHLLDLSMRYSLDPDLGLQMELTASNAGASPAPYGLGMHPYLTVGTPTIDACELSLPASTWLPVDDHGIPSAGQLSVEGSPLDFRKARPIGATVIDTAFSSLERGPDGRATVTLRDPASGRCVSLWVDQSFGWIQAFTGDGLADRRREGLAIEPMTCPPNAFVSGEDLIVLAPQETHTARWGILGS